jgi:hypothetical protein
VAKTAFMDSMNLSLLVLSIVLAVAAVFTALWAPGRDAEQLRFVRRLSARWSGPADEAGGPVTDHDDAAVRSTAGDRG